MEISISILDCHIGAASTSDIVLVFCVLVCKHYLTWVCLLAGEKVDTFPVIEIDQKDIVDTNGAGDAFVGGMIPKGFEMAWTEIHPV